MTFGVFLFIQCQNFLVEVYRLLWSGAKELWRSVGVMGYLGLAHLFANLCHEGLVDFPSKLARLILIAKSPLLIAIESQGVRIQLLGCVVIL